MEFDEQELYEIRQDYRNAASPCKQIGILADMHLCSKNDIREALGIKPKPKRKYVRYTEKQKNQIYSAMWEKIKEGKSETKASLECGIAISTFIRWRRENERRSL